MRRTPVWAAVPLAGSCLSARVHAQALTFDNSCGNSQWHTSCAGGQTNWTPEQIPTLLDDVTTSGHLVIASAGSLGARSLVADAGLQVIGSAVLGLVTHSQIHDLTLSAWLFSDGTLTLDGNSTAGGQARLYGNGLILNTGTLTGLFYLGHPTFGPTSFRNGAGATLTIVHPGYVRLQSFAAGPQSRLENFGTLNLIGSAELGGNGHTRVVNSGTIRRFPSPSGNNISQVATGYEQDGGVFDAQAGQTWFRSFSEWRAGQITIGQGAQVWLYSGIGGPTGHYLNGLAGVSGQGTFRFATSAVPVVVQAPVTFDLSGTPGLEFAQSTTVDALLTNEGNAAWTNSHIAGAGTIANGEVATFVLDAPNGGNLDADFRNGGFFEQRTDLTLQNATRFTNEQTGDHSLFQGDIGGSGAYENHGLLIKPQHASTLSSTISARLDQRGGTVAAVGDAIRLRGGGDWGAGGGTIEAAPQRSVDIESGTYVVSAPGHTLRTNVRVGPTAGLTPTIRVEAGGQLTTHGDFLLPVRVQRGALGGPGTILNTGRLEWFGGTLGIGGAGTLRNEDMLSIEGALDLRGVLINEDRVAQAAPVAMTNALIFNTGSWELWQPVTITASGASAIQNTGFIIHELTPAAPAISLIHAALDNQGTVFVPIGELHLLGPITQVQNGALVGGTWIVYPGARLVFAGTITRIQGATVEAGSTLMPAIHGVSRIVNSTVRLRGHMTAGIPFDEYEFSNLHVPHGWTFTAPGGFNHGNAASHADRLVSGSGGDSPDATAHIVTTLLTSHSRVLPGDEGAAGVLRLTGDYAQQAQGTLEIDLGGTTPGVLHDQLVITGAAQLGGTLRVALVAGFTPEAGQSFEILTASGGIAGQFVALIQPPTMPPGLTLRAAYGGETVTLEVLDACYPDCDTSGALNVNDYICFQTKFALGDPYADCDGSGVRNVNDYICFQTRFAIGCP